MKHHIDDDQTSTLLHKRMKNSMALQAEVYQSRMASPKHEMQGDHTHAFLIDCMQNYVDDNREGHNIASRAISLDMPTEQHATNPKRIPIASP